MMRFRQFLYFYAVLSVKTYTLLVYLFSYSIIRIYVLYMRITYDILTQTAGRAAKVLRLSLDRRGCL